MNRLNSNEGGPARIPVAFAAIDPYLEQNAVLPTEKVLNGKNRVEWGTGDRYPSYINDLYDTTPTLRSIINGSVDFVAGDEVTFAPAAGVPVQKMNHSGDTPRDIVRDLAQDTFKLGGFALQVIRSFDGQIAEVFAIPLDYLRSNKDNTVFYYCENWAKGRKDVLVYPKFMPISTEDWARMLPEERDRHASSIYLWKSTRRGTYPQPPFIAATKDCELERNVTDYHFNALENGFVSAVIVNFNNGIPEDEIKEEIEKDFNEKFCGHQNGARAMLSWNPNKDSATTIEAPKVEDFGERYKALATHSRQQIFASFRAVPALFGIMTESTGFNEQEFEQAFRLYNRTAIRPVQRAIGDAFDAIYGGAGILKITPFSLEGADTTVA